MGTATDSMWVKALSGIWPPVANTAADAMAPPPNPVLARAAPVALAVAVAAEPALPGPCVVDEPPATRPAAVLLDPAPVRINRLRRFTGFCWNAGLTSS